MVNSGFLRKKRWDGVRGDVGCRKNSCRPLLIAWDASSFKLALYRPNLDRLCRCGTTLMWSRRASTTPPEASSTSACTISTSIIQPRSWPFVKPPGPNTRSPMPQQPIRVLPLNSLRPTTRQPLKLGLLLNLRLTTTRQQL